MLSIERDKLMEWAFGLSVTAEERAQIAAIFDCEDNVEVPDELMKEEDDDAKIESVLDISKLSIPQKIKLALFGNQTARGILLRDTSSKQIPLFVLQNPRITDSEIHDIARNSNLDEQILRAVGTNAQWMKNYAVKVSIVSNPKVPIDISLKWVKFLQDKDLKRLSNSKNIPQVLSTHCRKLIENKKENSE